jgi:hypothetical protein
MSQHVLARQVESVSDLRAVTRHRDKAHTFVRPSRDLFIYDSAESAADDGYDTIKPTDVVGNGRWKRYRVGQDLFAVNVLSYGAAGDDLTDDTEAFQRALTAAAGKTLYIPKRTYLVDGATLTYPLERVNIQFEPGAIVNRPTSTNVLLKIPDGVTSRTQYRMYNAKVVGGNVLNQKFCEIADDSGLVELELYSPDITRFNKHFYFSAGDLAYIETTSVKVFGGRILPGSAANNELVYTPNSAGSYAYPTIATFDNCTLVDFTEFNAWTWNYDGDVVFNNILSCKVSASLTNAINGLTQLNICEFLGSGLGSTTLEIKGGTLWSLDRIALQFANMTLKVSSILADVHAKFLANAALVLNAPRITATVQMPAPSGFAAVAVDILEGADYCVVTGALKSSATALIRTAAKHGSFRCTYAGVGGTFVETGNADFNMLGCDPGLASGTGPSLVGENSRIEGDSVFEGYMQRDSATQISLQRAKGKAVIVNGEPVGIPSAGLTRDNDDNRIAGDGTDAGASLAVDTLYYVYVSNSRASFSPNSIRFSTVAPTLLQGVNYLAASGNGANWRFVGWIRTISNGGTPNFADSDTQRLVVNYYNRRKKKLFSCPGYTDDNAFTQISLTATSFAPLNGGTGDKLEYIANGEDEITIDIHASILPGAANVLIGIGDNSTTDATVAALIGAGTIIPASRELRTTPAAGYRAAHFLATNQAAATATIYFDGIRLGGAADPAITYIAGEISG